MTNKNTTFDCNICADEKSENEKITCPCGFDACKDCVKQYLLSRLEDAHCMSCKTGWGMKFLIDNFTKSWVEGNKKGQWRHYRKEIALDREKARIPEALAELPKIKARENAIKVADDLCKELKAELYEVKKQIQLLKNNKTVNVEPTPYTKKIKNFPTGHGITEEKARILIGYRKCEIPEGMYIRTTNAQKLLFKPNKTHGKWVSHGIYMGPPKHEVAIKWLAKKAGTPKRTTNRSEQLNAEKQKELDLRYLIRDANQQAYAARGRDDPALESPNFLCPCPDDDCKGMIESKGFSCVKCEKKICRRCREPREKDDGHKCDPQIIENIKFLKDDTKPCPNCATPIHKISGCDQMYCMHCHTAFSWRTGKLETGTIHNPHAIQWRRENGGQDRDINDIPCGGLVDFNMIKLSKPYLDKIQSIHRVVGEIDYRIHQPDNDFSDLRMAYVQDRIDEKKWRQLIFTRERENDRRNANADILVTLRTLAIERFRDLAHNARNIKRRTGQKELVNNFVEEMEKIRTFINKAFQEELPPLGTKKPLQIFNTTQGWWWSCDMWHRQREEQEQEYAE